MLKCVMAITIACKTEKSVIESSIAPEKKLKKKPSIYLYLGW